jgi:hypothetical protein
MIHRCQEVAEIVQQGGDDVLLVAPVAVRGVRISE